MRHRVPTWMYPLSYVIFTASNIVVLIMTAIVVTGADTNLYDDKGNFDPSALYTDFASTKFLLFTSIWTVAILVYVYSSQPIFDDVSPDNDWTRWTQWLEWQAGFFNAVIAHLVTWLFWFAGSITQSIWLGHGFWCIETHCRFLLPTSLAFDRGVLALAWLQVIFWLYPTANAMRNWIQQLKK